MPSSDGDLHAVTMVCASGPAATMLRRSFDEPNVSQLGAGAPAAEPGAESVAGAAGDDVSAVAATVAVPAVDGTVAAGSVPTGWVAAGV